MTATAIGLQDNEDRIPKRTAGPPTWKEENDVISIFKFFEMFPSEEAAVTWYEDHRWRDGLFCPRCGGDNAYRVKSGKPLSHRCRDCKRYFSVRIGTPLEGSNLPVRKWLLTVHLLLTDRKGESARKLHKTVETGRRTQWFLGHRVREMMREEEPLVLSGNLQVDEAFLGGKFANMHEWLKARFEGDPYGNKIGIVGLIDEEGRVVAQKLEEGDADELLAFVLAHAEQGSTIDSDGNPAYQQLPHFGYKHRSVDHKAAEYVGEDGQTTNRIECYWGQFKRQYHGSHHWMSGKHADRYLDESTFRTNLGQGNGPRSIGAVLDMGEKRLLTWKRLVGEEGQES